MNIKRLKDIMAGAGITCMAMACIVSAGALTGTKQVQVSYQNIKLVVNGQTVTPTDSKGNVVEPFTIDGTTYLPVRAVGNALGLQVGWDGATQTVTLNAQTPDGSPLPPVIPTQPAQEYIGEKKAKSVALADAGLAASGVTFFQVKLDWEDGRAVYDVEFYSGTAEYDYEIDALDGSIRSADREIEGYVHTPPTTSNNGNYITAERAKELALAHAGISAVNASMRKAEFDWDDGRAEYEVEFYSGNVKYEYTIDAVNGAVLSYEKDY